ncbi:MFS transporter [Natrarchaeobius chitinivorans]|uniref:MFS transporter n=1 Tax=Natrarchaeobius chitinivorans TaxID=1679083 RepID=A0A3N6MFB9_NATCH|nr:MFS transporter [Natrarchaeobius chitinivorans]RQG95410.1 MFS transporter [Natrarchaeobius chitinivorans]
MPSFVQRVTDVHRPDIVTPVTISHGITEFFSIAFPPIIPILVADLEITYGQAGLLVTVFFIMYSLFQLPAGVIGDYIGKTRLMLFGLVSMVGGIAFAGFAPNYETLIVAQAIAGVGGSTFHPTGMSIISDVETNETEGKAMGVFGFGGTLGTMAAPLVIGGIGELFGWRIALLVGATLGGIMTVFVLNLFVTASFSTSESLRPDGGSTLQERGDTLRKAMAFLTTRRIALLFLITLFVSLQHRAIQTFTTSYIAAETGVSISISNVAFFMLLLGGSIASLWAGDLADRFDRYYLGIGASLFTAMLVGATLLLMRLSTSLTVEALIPVMIVWFMLIGIAMYVSYPVKNALVSSEATEAYSGSLFGIIQTGSALGSAGGPAIFGFLATELGVASAFPMIAGASLILSLLFLLLMVLH